VSKNEAKLKNPGNPGLLAWGNGFAVFESSDHNQPGFFRGQKMKFRIASFIVSASMVFSTHCDAAFLDKEISFSEAEIQAAIDKSKPQQLNYGGLLTVSLMAPPKLTLGEPEGRAGIVARVDISLLGNPPIQVDVVGSAGIRYDDHAKAFFLEKPVADSVRSPALRKEAEPDARRAVTALLAGYFRTKPVYVLREDGNSQELAARWLLRSIRIEAGRVIAMLSPF